MGARAHFRILGLIAERRSIRHIDARRLVLEVIEVLDYVDQQQAAIDELGETVVSVMAQRDRLGYEVE